MRKHSVPLAQALTTEFTSSTSSLYVNGPSKVLKQLTIAKYVFRNVFVKCLQNNNTTTTTRTRIRTTRTTTFELRLDARGKNTLLN